VNLNNEASNANWNNGAGLYASIQIRAINKHAKALYIPTPLAVATRIAGDYSYQEWKFPEQTI
jgi:hypothetical protein